MKGIQSIITIDYEKPSCKSNHSPTWPSRVHSSDPNQSFLSVAYDIVLFWIFLMAEPNATIIAASIPSLRGLVRDVRNKSTNQYNSPGAAGYLRSTTSKFQMHTMPGGARRGGSDPTDHGANDGDSDKSILGHPKGHEGIERTTEVRVEYDLESRQSGQDGYEMQSRGDRDVKEYR